MDLGQLLDLEPPSTACRVTNERSGDVATSPQRAARRVDAGDRLTLQGTCLGSALIRKDLEVTGIGDETTGAPTLDGVGRGTVVTVKAGVTVTLREFTVRAGVRGIENHGDLTLDGVVVESNRGAQVGAGVHNAAGATLLLTGSSAIRRNTASLAGGGVLNAGTLELRGASTIARNVVRDEGRGTDEVDGVTDVLDRAHPLLGGSPVDGIGGGLTDLGTLVGVVCAPELGANVRNNRPDDCVSLTSPTVVPPPLDVLAEGEPSEPLAPDEGTIEPAATPDTEPPVPYRGP